MMTTTTVYDYRTGERLDGIPSPQLVKESEATTLGAVAAYRDDDGCWQYLGDQAADHYRRLGHQALTVYVVANAAEAKAEGACPECGYSYVLHDFDDGEVICEVDPTPPIPLGGYGL